MTIETALPAAAPASRRPSFVLGHWPLFAGLLIVAVPAIAHIAEQSWSTEGGAHGPIVLATGLWLLLGYNKFRANRVVPVSAWPWALGCAVALAAYVFGRAYDFLSLEAAGVYGAFLLAALHLADRREMMRNAFPFLYLGFIVPPPGWLIDRLTAPLQTFISWVSVELLQAFGYPVARNGVTLTVAQYELLVEQACAGMNSITGLVAITLFYIYLMHHASWRYALLLVAFILPLAVLVNLVRVVALILVTYHFGDATAQGFLHVTTGMVLFMMALALIFVIDWGLRTVLPARFLGTAK